MFTLTYEVPGQARDDKKGIIVETILETERLILRPIDGAKDFPFWAEMMADADSVKYLWNNTPCDENAAWQNMTMNIGHWQVRGYGFFSVILKETGEWVGRIGPYYPHGWPAPEIGFLHAVASERQVGDGFLIMLERDSGRRDDADVGWLTSATKFSPERYSCQA